MNRKSRRFRNVFYTFKTVTILKIYVYISQLKLNVIVILRSNIIHLFRLSVRMQHLYHSTKD